MVEDRGGAIRIGDHRFELSREDVLRVAGIARGAADLPSGAGQAPAQMPAAASATDDQRARQASLSRTVAV
ncbi:MAG: hypothetical protein AUG48_02060 [Actinobacteria bacterium 13_1_20CM_3_68_9]|nr:MAG: hypothetical protein AUG48_02060 [Actinobacteria bacterium 13_1_20CM_3_68_9]